MSGETQVEVQLHHAIASHPAMSDPMTKLSLGGNGLHSSGGSTGDDSSGEEPTHRHHHHHHHVVLPKKIRLKEPKNISIKSTSSLISMICQAGGGGGSSSGSSSRDENLMDDQSPDGDDDCNSLKDGGGGSVGGGGERGGMTHSLTSGENSDDADADGEDHVGFHSSKSEKNCRLPIECDVCNMRFSNGANMRRHRMRHSGIKPFECKICQKRFFRKDHLAEHMATHSKLLPFRCPICNKVSGAKDSSVKLRCELIFKMNTLEVLKTW
ncbi:Asparagine-rich zinc finger protein AZF1 [Folsomia candida]|uniref:Asparagine-rich zinc finger protein AZF1 n=1 Tax=Folsomia candida TaxID=158441 RepID=A0A226DJ97_FOLCA|nr:Asparagine-rich zinc finger protein AZF1 [Folsomia candida]